MTDRNSAWLKVAAAVTSMLLIVCGCDSGTDGQYDSPILNEDIPVTDIAELPDIEQTRTQMLDLIEQVRVEVTRLVPASEPWRWNRDESRSVCAQKGTGHKGVSLGTRNLISDLAFTDEQWALVFPAVQRLAGEARLTTVTVMADASGNHDVRFSSDDGRTLVFGTAEASVISGRIACRRSAVTDTSVQTPAPSTGSAPTSTTGSDGS